jgi:hypothetical protein
MSLLLDLALLLAVAAFAVGLAYLAMRWWGPAAPPPPAPKRNDNAPPRNHRDDTA